MEERKIFETVTIILFADVGKNKYYTKINSLCDLKNEIQNDRRPPAD